MNKLITNHETLGSSKLVNFLIVN